jgi:hypothetical protein
LLFSIADILGFEKVAVDGVELSRGFRKGLSKGPEMKALARSHMQFMAIELGLFNVWRCMSLVQDKQISSLFSIVCSDPSHAGTHFQQPGS